MRIAIKETKVYKFDELSEKAQGKALEKQAESNTSDLFWSESTIEDAKNIGLKITAWDITNRHDMEGSFIASAEETAHEIEKEHGKICETYKSAKSYLADRDKLIDEWPKDENGDNENERNLDYKLDALDSEFLKSLLEDYRIVLSKEYEYVTSAEHCKEDIEANDYEFTEDGEIY